MTALAPGNLPPPAQLGQAQSPAAGQSQWWNDPGKMNAYQTYQDAMNQNSGTVVRGHMDANNNNQFVGDTAADTAQYQKNLAANALRPSWFDNSAEQQYNEFKNPGSIYSYVQPIGGAPGVSPFASAD